MRIDMIDVKSIIYVYVDDVITLFYVYPVRIYPHKKTAIGSDIVRHVGEAVQLVLHAIHTCFLNSRLLL